MANYKESELTKQKIELKVSGSLETGVPDPSLPASDPEQEKAVVSVPADAVKPADRGADPLVDEQQVAELLKNPDSEEFLRAIDRMTPDEIGRILHVLNERDNWYGQCFRQLTAVPEEPRNEFSIIAWWESRRIVFNLLVGAAGLPTVAILALLMHASLYWILEGVVAYGIAANVCYTAGCVSELVARRFWAEKAKDFGPILLTLGLAFSFFITLLAIVYMPLVSIGGRWLFGI